MLFIFKVFYQMNDHQLHNRKSWLFLHGSTSSGMGRLMQIEMA